MISKAVRRMLAASLAVITAMGAAGCGKETPVETPVTDAEQDATLPEGYTLLTDENGNVLDFGGMHVTVLDWWAEPFDKQRPRDTAFDEAKWDYIEWMEETYNFTVEEKANGTWDTNQKDFKTYVSEPDTGEFNYVYVVRSGDALASFIDKGFMKDLNSLGVFDWNEPKFTQNNTHKSMQSGDKIFGMRTIAPEPRGVVYFNKRILEEAGYEADTLYDLQKNNEWTWAKFEEVLQAVQKDIDGDQIIDIYGMVQQNIDLFTCATIVNGGSFVDKDENGNYIFNLDNPKTIEALNWSIEIRDLYSMPAPEEGAWNWFITEFRNGKAGFMIGQTYMAAQDLKRDQMEEDFGCLAFPLGPNSDGYRGYYTDNVYVIPGNYTDEKAQKIAKIYDLYTSDVPGFQDTEDGWKLSFYNSMRDTRSVDESLTYLVENGTPMYEGMVSGISLGNDILYNLGYHYAPAERAEAIKQQWQTHLDAANGR